MKNLIEWLAREDDRLFQKMPWVILSGVGLATSFGAFVWYRSQEEKVFFVSHTLFAGERNFLIMLAACTCVLLYLFPRYLPYVLFALTLYIGYQAYFFVGS